MKERAADMCGPEGGDGHAGQAVNREQLLEKQAVFGPDRRELELAEHSDRRPVGGGCHPADDRLHNLQRI
jgi:hypothetical protein